MTDTTEPRIDEWADEQNKQNRVLHQQLSMLRAERAQMQAHIKKLEERNERLKTALGKTVRYISNPDAVAEIVSMIETPWDTGTK